MNDHESMIAAHRARLEKRAAFCAQQLGYWYESAPYGEQIPSKLPAAIVKFLQSLGVECDEEKAWEILTTDDEPWCQAWINLFEPIFMAGASHTLDVLENAVFDVDAEKLELIDLQPVGLASGFVRASLGEVISNPPPPQADFLRKLWATLTHRHQWVMTNDASMADVPDEYPPSRVCYVSPKRKCLKCGAGEWYVGPEVCGGSRARWVPALVDYSPPNN